MVKVKAFIDKYNCEERDYQSEKDDFKKKLRKVIWRLLLMFRMLKTKKIILPLFLKHN